jgi:hypothetical protein
MLAPGPLILSIKRNDLALMEVHLMSEVCVPLRSIKVVARQLQWDASVGIHHANQISRRN